MVEEVLQHEKEIIEEVKDKGGGNEVGGDEIFDELGDKKDNQVVAI